MSASITTFLYLHVVFRSGVVVIVFFYYNHKLF